MATDKKMQKYEVPLDGKLNTWDDPAKIGTKFQQLTNLRYTETHPKGVGGMTKINSANIMDATYLKTRSAFHYNKDQPQESHVLVEAFNTGLTASQILDNKAVIPAVGDFEAIEVYTPTMHVADPKAGRFSAAPDGDMAYCNGEESCVWGGNEREVGAFFTDTAAVTTAMTTPKDYTDKVRNTLATADEVAVVGGGNDTFTELLLPFDTNFTDVSSNTFAVATEGGGIAISTAQKKFGAASCFFDGTDDYLGYTDNAVFHMAAGVACIDFWIRPGGSPAIAQDGIFSHRTNATDKVEMTYFSHDVYFSLTVGGVLFSLHTTGDKVPENTWTHIAVIRGWGGNVNDWALCINGVAIDTDTNAIVWGDFTGEFEIGRHYNEPLTAYQYFGSGGDTGWIDDFRVSKASPRWTSDFIPPINAYSATYNYFIVGSVRPLQGIKLYVASGNGNTEAAPTLTGTYWNGSSWTALGTFVDNTVGLATTGTLTWDSTVDTAKQRYLEGLQLYFYQFVLSAGQADIYYATVDAPFQEVVDIWDGMPRSIDSFQVYLVNKYKDSTLNVRENNYVSLNDGTFVELDALATATDHLICGFVERITGISFTFVSGHVNTTAATVATVSYWDGSAWVSVGVLNDGTLGNAISFGKTGVISWNQVGSENEFTKAISNDAQLYYYRIAFSANLSADVQVYYISGIPIQKKISAYEFPMYANDRLWLCNDAKGKVNSAICSSLESSSVFNGDDSVEYEFGDQTSLIGGAWLYSQFGSSLYSVTLFLKYSEMWALVGSDPEGWIKYRVSAVVGCAAPETLKVIDLGPETAQTLNRNVVIWQGSDGIYMSDGRSPILISKDIQDKFDKRKTGSINTSKIGDSQAVWDNDNKCYHWLWASGTSTTLNEEYVFDFNKQAWFNIDRTSTKDLQAAITVKDISGVSYNYGFIDTGYMERLEYGNSFDGQDIAHTLHFGDMVLANGSIVAETTVEHSCLIAIAKATTTSDITLTHYGDGATTGTSWTESPTKAGYRIIYPVEHRSLGSHIFHSVKITTSTNDETVGFEPLYFYMLYEITREHLRSWRE